MSVNLILKGGHFRILAKLDAPAGSNVAWCLEACTRCNLATSNGASTSTDPDIQLDDFPHHLRTWSGIRRTARSELGGMAKMRGVGWLRTLITVLIFAGLNMPVATVAEERRFDEARERTAYESRVEDRLGSWLARMAPDRSWPLARSQDVDEFSRAYADYTVVDCEGKPLSDCEEDPKEWICCALSVSKARFVTTIYIPTEELTDGQLDQIADWAGQRIVASQSGGSAPDDFGVGIHISEPVPYDGMFRVRVGGVFVGRFWGSHEPPTAPREIPDPLRTPPADAVPVTAAMELGGLPSVCEDRFSDLDEWSHIGGAACRLARSGVTEGYSDGTFRPAPRVTRGQMSSFIAGALRAAGIEVADGGEADYKDELPPAHSAAIEALTEIGIVTGFPDGTFRAHEYVTRAQMAAFLARAAEHALGERLPTPEQSYFDDTNGNPHEEAIEKLALARIASGVAPRLYEPGTHVTRRQMATFLFRWNFVVRITIV